MRLTLRSIARLLAVLLAPVLLVYVASFWLTFSRISLAGPTFQLHRGTIHACWLATPIPWRSAEPSPGWHIQRGSVGLRFRGQPTVQGLPPPMYGPHNFRARLEYALIPLVFLSLALWLLARAPKGVCRGCEYDLVGLPVDAACPECGRAQILATWRFA